MQRLVDKNVDDAHDDGDDDGNGGGVGHGVGAGGHQNHQNNQGQQQIQLGGQLPELGKLVFGDALQAQLLGFQMDGDEDAGEVQEGGQNGQHHDLLVDNAGRLRHDEGGGAHDGGHDLAAGGGRGFHRAGELTLIAGLLHHRDGDGAGGDGVAHGGAGHHAAQGGGDDGHLGRAAGGGASHAVGQADKEIGNSGALQKRAENDKHDNKLLAGGNGGADDAVGGVKQVKEGLAQADIRPKGRKGIHNQNASHAQDGQAHAAAAQLHHDQNADHREGKQHGVGADNGVVGQGDLLRVKGEVEKGDAPHNHDDDVVPGQAVHLDMALPDGEIQISDDDNPAQESAQAKFGLVSVNQGQIYTEQGKSNCDELYNPLGGPLPHTDVGLPVKLFHDLVHIGRAPNLLGIRRGSADGRRNFLLFFPKTHVLLSFRRFVHTTDCGGV